MTQTATAPVPVLYGASHDGFDADRYLLERYLAGTPASRVPTALFYRLKPLIPRRVQMAARRLLAGRARRRHQSGGAFPRWPMEPVLADALDARLHARLEASGAGEAPFIGLWPSGHRFAYTLTHDVEGPVGLRGADALLEIERRHGAVSGWFVVGDDYAVDATVLARMRDAGGEVALHGLHHDGRLFESRRAFEAQLPAIHDRLRAWGAEGFRSPALHRRADWMPELGAAYDSSFPDTQPFDVGAGGCCSILPYFIGDLVELPITMPQDHTLFELFREPDISLWRQKAAWIARRGGLVNVIVHPDYALTAERLARYDELLTFLEQLGGGWCALPRDVARWWRRRRALEVALAEGTLRDGALEGAGAVLWRARDLNGPLATAPDEAMAR